MRGRSEKLILPCIEMHQSRRAYVDVSMDRFQGVNHLSYAQQGGLHSHLLVKPIAPPTLDGAQEHSKHLNHCISAPPPAPHSKTSDTHM